jgi:subtilisin family serine protease
MTGRRLFLLFVLVCGLSVHASPPSYPLIVQIPLTTDITNIVTALGGKVIDAIPGAGAYLLRVQAVPPSWMLSHLGIQWTELNEGATLPGFGELGVLALPQDATPDWYKQQPSMQLIRSADALLYSTGRAVVIADINSKVDVAHPALIGHLTTGYDFVANKPTGLTALNQSSASFMDQPPSFIDQSSASFMDRVSATFLNQSSASFMDDNNPAYSHGTLCVGVIAAVAPDSMIMPLRVFNDQGSADVFTIAKAIRYAVQQGAQVINMSYGTLNDSPTLQSAIKFALNKNVVVVASAGNKNTSVPQYPAAYNGVITVAATDLFDRKAPFSNYGGYVYVDAPGVNIFSAYPGGYYSVVSGTSFSAPAVAGTAALIRSMHATGVPGFIAGAAINIDSKNPNYAGQLGYGRIDVLRAVKPD